MIRGQFGKGFLTAGIITIAINCFALGCNPCNDLDGIVTNVNNSSFSGPELTVVTFNMLHGFDDRINDATLENRLAILAQEIVDTRPDVVLLQEASVTDPGVHCNVIESLAGQVNDSLPGQQDSYNWIYARANGSADLINFEEGSAILSRHEILASQVSVYSHHVTSLPALRIALRVTIRGDSGNIDFFGTHLTNLEDMEGDELVRTLQARELAGVIIPGRGNSNPVVVGGDFNDPPGSETILEMTGTGAVDLFADQNPGIAGYTSFADPFDITNPAEEADQRIDYLFLLDGGAAVTDSVLFLDAARDIDPGPEESWLWASDHIGVLARIRPSGY